jgi:hypothetical protein
MFVQRVPSGAMPCPPPVGVRSLVSPDGTRSARHSAPRRSEGSAIGGVGWGGVGWGGGGWEEAGKPSSIAIEDKAHRRGPLLLFCAGEKKQLQQVTFFFFFDAF